MSRVVIVGAGLAGACAAAWLSDRHEVLVVDAADPASGASGAAAGLVNPFPGQRAAPVWRIEEALAAFADTTARAGIAQVEHGLFRPAKDFEQAVQFSERADEHPLELEWIQPPAARERWPMVRAPHGGLWVRRGQAVDIPALIAGLLWGLHVRTNVSVIDFGESGGKAWLEAAEGERIEADTILLAPGDGVQHLPHLRDLPLGRVKGQTVSVTPPPSLRGLPLLAGAGYAAPIGESLVLGTTYEHDFNHRDPTPEATRQIVERVSRMVPALADCAVVDERAGVRVTVPARVSPRRLPMIGPLPGFENVWGMVGLGSKGLLTAPLLARLLPDLLTGRASIPDPVLLRIEPAGRT